MKQNDPDQGKVPDLTGSGFTKLGEKKLFLVI